MAQAVGRSHAIHQRKPCLGLPGSAEYALSMLTETIETRAHTTDDGILNLRVDVGVPDFHRRDTQPYGLRQNEPKLGKIG
jgi:hypothetical protein